MRRNTHKPWPDGGGEVFDATIEVPVTIRNPDKPIGTHVFTAMARNDAGLRWTAVTIDNGDDAKDALDRITIPQDVLDRIAPTALPRSSIIVSDEPLSRETNYRTEFVAVLSNQPQGGFLTRRPTVAVPVASGNLGQRRLRLLFPARLELPTPTAIRVSAAVSLIIRRNGAIPHNKAIRCSRAFRCNRAGGETRYAGRMAAQGQCAPNSARSQKADANREQAQVRFVPHATWRRLTPDFCTG